MDLLHVVHGGVFGHDSDIYIKVSSVDSFEDIVVAIKVGGYFLLSDSDPIIVFGNLLEERGLGSVVISKLVEAGSVGRFAYTGAKRLLLKTSTIHNGFYVAAWLESEYNFSKNLNVDLLGFYTSFSLLPNTLCQCPRCGQGSLQLCPQDYRLDSFMYFCYTCGLTFRCD